MSEHNHNCIGGYLDLQGFQLIRFDLKDGNFIVLKSFSGDTSGYDAIVAKILELSRADAGEPSAMVTILSNFPVDLKRLILNQSQDWQPAIRVRSTNVSDCLPTRVFSLKHLISQKRLIVPESESTVSNALSDLNRLDRLKPDESMLSRLTFCLLHSISWIESELIRLSV